MYASPTCPHTHKHNRRESTSVIGSLIFASARRQAPWDCEYRYSMTALRANKTDNPPSVRRCLSPTDRFSPSSPCPSLPRSPLIFVLSSFRYMPRRSSIPRCSDIRISQDYGGFMLGRTIARKSQAIGDNDK